MGEMKYIVKEYIRYVDQMVSILDFILENDRQVFLHIMKNDDLGWPKANTYVINDVDDYYVYITASILADHTICTSVGGFGRGDEKVYDTETDITKNNIAIPIAFFDSNDEVKHHALKCYRKMLLNQVERKKKEKKKEALAKIVEAGKKALEELEELLEKPEDKGKMCACNKIHTKKQDAKMKCSCGKGGYPNDVGGTITGKFHCNDCWDEIVKSLVNQGVIGETQVIA